MVGRWSKTQMAIWERKPLVFKVLNVGMKVSLPVRQWPWLHSKRYNRMALIRSFMFYKWSRQSPDFNPSDTLSQGVMISNQSKRPSATKRWSKESEWKLISHNSVIMWWNVTISRGMNMSAGLCIQPWVFLLCASFWSELWGCYFVRLWNIEQISPLFVVWRDLQRRWNSARIRFEYQCGQMRWKAARRKQEGCLRRASRRTLAVRCGEKMEGRICHLLTVPPATLSGTLWGGGEGTVPWCLWET